MKKPVVYFKIKSCISPEYNLKRKLYSVLVLGSYRGISESCLGNISIGETTIRLSWWPATVTRVSFPLQPPAQILVTFGAEN